MDEYMLEKSHGKLKYDFRIGYDFDTGHMLKIVFSLDNIKVDGTGRTTNYDNWYPPVEHEDKDKIHKDVEKTIRSKGHLDHRSSGQMVLGITDMKTNERLKSARVIGLYTDLDIDYSNDDGGPSNDVSKHLQKFKNDQNFIDKYVRTLTVGEVETDHSFKSTFLPKAASKLDDIGRVMTPLEKLGQLRGSTKLGDITGVSTNAKIIKRKNPSGKDIRRNKRASEDKENISKELDDVTDRIELLNKQLHEISVKKHSGKITISEFNSKNNQIRSELEKLYNSQRTLRFELQQYHVAEAVEDILEDELFEEKKSRVEYNMKKFKEKYKYDPRDSTIEIDGKRVKVDIGKSRIVSTDDGYYMPRDVCAFIQGEEKIILSPDFFELKNAGRRDAILQHEVGHLKMHRRDGSNSKLFDKRFIDADIIRSDFRDTLIDAGYTDEREINDIIDAYIEENNDIKEFLGKKVTDENLEKLRKEAKRAANKYIGKSRNGHLNITEIEADRYAANKTSEKNVRRGLRESIKKLTRDKEARKKIKSSLKAKNMNAHNDEDNDMGDYDPNQLTPMDLYFLRNEEVKRAKKAYNINADDDYKRRSKALKDKTLRNSPLYREYGDSYTESKSSSAEAEAKKTLKSISENIIKDLSKNSSNRIQQSTVNTIANVITNNLLPIWAKGYKSVKITLNKYNQPDKKKWYLFEFDVPELTDDFISRFIDGRETLTGFLHKNPTINIKISPRIFNELDDSNDIYKFFKKAIKYYDDGIDKAGREITREVMRMGHNMKQLISTTALRGIVTYPLSLLFAFDDVRLDNPDVFKVSESDIKAINKFIGTITSRYRSPEKEKKKIVSDIGKLVKELRESCEELDSSRRLLQFQEAVEKFYTGGYDDNIIESSRWFIESNIDRTPINNPQLKVLYERFGVKKLKKLPRNIITYITIEAENIRSANDKLMLASYCMSKIEICEWYIELLEVGSRKYVVPHDKPYLERFRTQLLECYKKIMDTKVINPSSRPIIDIQYPKGYEG